MSHPFAPPPFHRESLQFKFRPSVLPFVCPSIGGGRLVRRIIFLNEKQIFSIFAHGFTNVSCLLLISNFSFFPTFIRSLPQILSILLPSISPLSPLSFSLLATFTPASVSTLRSCVPSVHCIPYVSPPPLLRSCATMSLIFQPLPSVTFHYTISLSWTPSSPSISPLKIH